MPPHTGVLFPVCTYHEYVGFYEKLVYAVENVLQYNNAYNLERQQHRSVISLGTPPLRAR